MAVIEKGKITSLSDSSLKEFENNVVKYENLVRRKKQTDSQLSRANKSKSRGVFSQNADTAPLPSSITKKQRNSGTSRADQSGLLSKFKLKDKTSKSAFEHQTEWKKTQDRIKGIETEQKAFKKMFIGLPGLLGGAANLTTGSGILSSLTGLASKIPHIAMIIGIATVAAKAYVVQHGAGKTRDTRVKRLDESSALTSVSDETEILGAERLFLSNPNTNHGLPSGNSNTQNLRAGIRTHKLRRDGVYY